METLNIEKFNPKKAEIIALAAEFKGLSILGIDDREGYQKVHEARIKLKTTRVDIQKQGKLLRSEALAFQKKVIEVEKEFVAIIEPIEKDLESKQKAIDLEKETLARKVLLPIRQERLKEIDVVVEDSEILAMNEEQFAEFFNTKKAEYLEEKERRAKAELEEQERKLQEERDRIEAEKKKFEEEKRIEEARKLAEKEAQEKALIDAEIAKKKAEQEKQEAIEAEKKRAEDEKLLAEKKAKDDLERVEREKNEAIEKIKREQAEKEQMEKDLIAKQEKERLEKEEALRLEQEKNEKNKKYKNWLVKNGVSDETRKDFNIVQTIEGKKVKFTLYKKIDSILI